MCPPWSWQHSPLRRHIPPSVQIAYWYLAMVALIDQCGYASCLCLYRVFIVTYLLRMLLYAICCTVRTGLYARFAMNGVASASGSRLTPRFPPHSPRNCRQSDHGSIDLKISCWHSNCNYLSRTSLSPFWELLLRHNRKRLERALPRLNARVLIVFFTVADVSHDREALSKFGVPQEQTAKFLAIQ